MNTIKNKRILIAGHEIGGQMQLLAEQMRKRGVEAHAAAFNTDFRKYKTDIRIISGRFPFKRFLFFLKAIFYYDVFHFFWGVSLFDFWVFHGLDLPLLRLLKKKVIVHFRGTDIFNMDYYEYLNRLALGEQVPPPPKSRHDQQVRINLWRKYANEIWVSTPDLKQLVPEGRIIPQVIDVAECKHYAKTSTIGHVFRIGHAPSRRNTKGTAFLVDAVHALQKKGIPVELDLIEGELPHLVLERLSQCDVVVDQLLLGWYGKVTVEAMALGKPVLCYIDPDLMRYRPDLPIVNVTPATLTAALEKLIVDKGLRESIGSQSQAYAAQYHDVEKIVDDLLVQYGFAERTNVRERIDDASMW